MRHPALAWMRPSTSGAIDLRLRRRPMERISRHGSFSTNHASHGSWTAVRFRGAGATGCPAEQLANRPSRRRPSRRPTLARSSSPLLTIIVPSSSLIRAPWRQSGSRVRTRLIFPTPSRGHRKGGAFQFLKKWFNIFSPFNGAGHGNKEDRQMATYRYYYIILCSCYIG